jgi:hypothetical protein
MDLELVLLCLKFHNLLLKRTALIIMTPIRIVHISMKLLDLVMGKLTLLVVFIHSSLIFAVRLIEHSISLITDVVLLLLVADLMFHLRVEDVDS